MAIFTRLSRLFKADFHAVIDQLEEPLMLLKQSVREMEIALQQDQARLKTLQQQQSQIIDRVREQEERITQINEELNVCFQAENETLARVLIKRKLESQQLHKLFANKQKSLAQQMAEIQQRIDERQPRLEAMQQKLQVFAEEASQNNAEQLWTSSHVSVTDADIEVALLREKQQRSQS